MYPLFPGKPPVRLPGVFVSYPYDAVDDALVVNLWNKTRAKTLNFVRARFLTREDCRRIGLNGINLNRRIPLLKSPTNAAYGAPVPTPATTISTLPSVSFQISTPVVRS